MPASYWRPGKGEHNVTRMVSNPMNVGLSKCTRRHASHSKNNKHRGLIMKHFKYYFVKNICIYIFFHKVRCVLIEYCFKKWILVKPLICSTQESIVWKDWRLPFCSYPHKFQQASFLRITIEQHHHLHNPIQFSSARAVVPVGCSLHPVMKEQSLGPSQGMGTYFFVATLELDRAQCGDSSTGSCIELGPKSTSECPRVTRASSVSIPWIPAH